MVSCSGGLQECRTFYVVMKDMTSRVKTTIGVVSLTATLIPCEKIGCETYESIGFDSSETIVDPARAEVCAHVCIGGTKVAPTYILLGVEEALPLCPIVVHSSFCFPFVGLAGAFLGRDLTLDTAKGKSLILCSTE